MGMVSTCSGGAPNDTANLFSLSDTANTRAACRRAHAIWRRLNMCSPCRTSLPRSVTVKGTRKMTASRAAAKASGCPNWASIT